MSEPDSVEDDQLDKTTSGLLEVRQFAIGLTRATERLLESLGHPVESAIVTRKERRSKMGGRREPVDYHPWQE